VQLRKRSTGSCQTPCDVPKAAGPRRQQKTRKLDRIIIGTRGIEVRGVKIKARSNQKEKHGIEGADPGAGDT